MTTITINNVPLKVKLALTPQQQKKGLMNTQAHGPAQLSQDEGMLFVYTREELLSFWMKNTSLDLSIAFINKDKEIIDIHKMNPNDITPVSSKQPAQYALEVNQGWFEKNNISRGDKVKIPENIMPKLIKVRIT